ncbi:MAG: hypothetical protein PF518_01155, partial [Spirochaetaceae bacterium]|nr:hypothetical protein [Spirochaetaceae bacterium]
MVFLPGDFIVLGILGILILVLRQFDKNNRSLEKVRNYADKVRAQLDEIVQEKREAIKDLSIDIDIQEKTDKEILKRVQAAREEINGHAENIESINDKVIHYSERVDELISMTGQVDENLLKIKDESEYVDTVGKRISDSLRKIQLLEKAMGSLQDEFVRQNQLNLDKFQDRLLSSSEERIKSVEEKVLQSDQIVSNFQNTVNALDIKHNTVSEEKLSLFIREMDAVKEKYNEYLEDVAEKGLRLEAEVFDELNNSINTTADRIEENWKNGLNTLKDTVSTSVEGIKERLVTTEEGIHLVESDLDKKIIQMQSYLADSVEEAKSVSENTIHKTTETIESFENQLENRFTNINHTIELTENDINTKTETIKAGIAQVREESQAGIAQVSEDTQALAETVFAKSNSLIENHEKEAEARLNVVTGRFNDHEELMEKHAAEVLDRCKMLINEHEQDSSALLDKIRTNMSEVTGFSHDIENQMNHFKIEIDKETETLSEKLNMMSENLSQSIEVKAVELETGLIKSVEDKVGEYEQSVSRRFDKLDGFMEDLDNLEENLKISLKEAVASVERDFQIFNENLMEERAAFKNSLGEDTDDIRFQMSELEKGLEALKSQAYENVSEKLKV